MFVFKSRRFFQDFPRSVFPLFFRALMITCSDCGGLVAPTNSDVWKISADRIFCSNSHKPAIWDRDFMLLTLKYNKWHDSELGVKITNFTNNLLLSLSYSK